MISLDAGGKARPNLPTTSIDENTMHPSNKLAKFAAKFSLALQIFEGMSFRMDQDRKIFGARANWAMLTIRGC